MNEKITPEMREKAREIFPELRNRTDEEVDQSFKLAKDITEYLKKELEKRQK